LEGGRIIKKSAVGKDYSSGAGKIRHTRMELQILSLTQSRKGAKAKNRNQAALLLGALAPWREIYSRFASSAWLRAKTSLCNELPCAAIVTTAEKSCTFNSQIASSTSYFSLGAVGHCIWSTAVPAAAD
jgi:hypothetical protein